MESDLACDGGRYIVVTPLPFSLTDDNLYAVDDLCGYDLEALLTVFPNLHVFAPFDSEYESTKYGYVFSQQSAITFQSLPYFVSTFELLRKMPRILAILVRNIKKRDIVQSAGSIYQPVGALALISCAIMRHRNRILVLDADHVQDLEASAQVEQRGIRKFFLLILKHIIKFTLQFLILVTPLTFVVGDSLYSSYSHIGNVKKIYASWISRDYIISQANLVKKVLTTLKSSSFRLVFAAGLVHKKGPDIAVKVAAILHRKGIPITLDIYGVGPMRDELLRLIEGEGVSHLAALKGTVNYETFHHVMTTYDILLLPNLSGEQPRVLFDAMANGVLAIASDIVSLSDLITNDHNGILCDPRDPDSFAVAVERLYLNKKILEPLLYNGMLTARQNTIESMHEKRKSVIQATFY